MSKEDKIRRKEEKLLEKEHIKNEKIEKMRKQKEKDAIKGISFRPKRISRNRLL